MRVLLLGATGLIGGPIAAGCQARGFECVRPGRTEIDLADLARIDLFPLDGFDAVVHAGGVTDEEVAADRGEALLRAGIAAGRLFDRCVVAGVRRFVYISSSHVYGPFEGVKTEHSPPNPLSDYALCHFATEQVLRRSLRRGGASALIVRPNAVFGMPPDPSRFNRWSLIPFEFPRDLAQRGVITIRSTGEQARNFISTEDIADGAAAWLASDSASDASIWNPVGPLTCSVYEFGLLCKDVFERSTGRPGRVERGTAAASGAGFRLESEWTLTAPSRTPEQFVSEMIEWQGR